MRTNRRVVVAPVLALAALLGGTGIGEAQATISIKKADGTALGKALVAGGVTKFVTGQQEGTARVKDTNALG
jgi:hypothetical protein